MAKIEIVTNVTDIEVLKSKAFDPDAQGYKTLIKELIRLDVPILEVGSSSIGKLLVQKKQNLLRVFQIFAELPPILQSSII
jgi:hypothetical protein